MIKAIESIHIKKDRTLKRKRDIKDIVLEAAEKELNNKEEVRTLTSI